MGAPNLTTSVEPMELGAVVYAPLAPKSATSNANGIVALKLSIRNNETKSVHVSEVRVSFTGSPAAGAVAIPVALNIAPNATASWHFAAANEIVVPHPAPPTIRVRLACNGFDTPTNTLLPLAAHKSPTVAGSYRFPARARDLRLGEYWSGQSQTHAEAGDGSQLFAYDLGVVGWDPTKKDWVETLPGTTGTKNEDYRIWGKPIYAAADGTVVEFADDRPDNLRPGEDFSPPDPVEGNHFYIQHGDELFLYAHFIKGSLTKSLLKKGAAVKQGDKLGLAGHSGNSSHPHLHIHVIQGTQPWGGPPRPLPLNGLQVLERSALKPPSPAGAWVKADDQCLPNALSAIWPEATAPTWYPPGWPEVARHGIHESDYQVEFERIAKSGYRPVWIDGYDVNGETFFNVIFRPEDGTPWVARHGLGAADYQKAWDTFVGQQGFRLAHVETYVSKGRVRYAAIFVKVAGPAFTAYHGVSGAEHKKSFDKLTKDGFRPVNISPVSPSGDPVYAALYEKRDVGGFFTKNTLTPAEYQAAFDENAKAGRRLAYIAAYTHGGAPRFSAIWNEKAPGAAARHGMSAGGYQTEYDARRGTGLLTRAVTGYEENDVARFAALWTK